VRPFAAAYDACVIDGKGELPPMYNTGANPALATGPVTRPILFPLYISR